MKNASLSSVRLVLMTATTAALILIAFYISTDPRDHAVLQARKTLEKLRDVDLDRFGEAHAVRLAQDYVDKDEAFWKGADVGALPRVPRGKAGLFEIVSGKSPPLHELINWLMNTDSIVLYFPDSDSLDAELKVFETSLDSLGGKAESVFFKRSKTGFIEVTCVGYVTRDVKDSGVVRLLGNPRWTRGFHNRDTPFSLRKELETPLVFVSTVKAQVDTVITKGSIYRWLFERHSLQPSYQEEEEAGGNFEYPEELAQVEKIAANKTVFDGIEYFDNKLQRSKASLTLVGISVAASPTLFFVLGPLLIVILLVIVNGHLSIAEKTLSSMSADIPERTWLLFDVSGHGNFFRWLHTLVASTALALALVYVPKNSSSIWIADLAILLFGCPLAFYTNQRICQVFRLPPATRSEVIVPERPKGLFVLTGAVAVERLSYFGMRAVLVLYMVRSLMMRDFEAFGTYGAFSALIYATPVLGGRLADTVLGYRRAVLFGGIIMAVGLFMILGGTETWMLIGLSTIAIGNGFYKPSILTMVGNLYDELGPRRESGFTYVYLGITIGALLATVTLAPIGVRFGLRWTFGLAGAGMLISVAIIMLSRLRLVGTEDGPDPEPYRKWGRAVYSVSLGAIPFLYVLIRFGEDLLLWVLCGLMIFACTYLVRASGRGGKVPRDRIVALLIIMIFNIAFWGCFALAEDSLMQLADRNVDLILADNIAIPISQIWLFNPAFLLILGPLFSAIWIRLAKSGYNPKAPIKIGTGIILLGLSYLMIQIGRVAASPEAAMPLSVLTVMQLLQSAGELFMVPIGLSAVSGLAPRGMSGMALGTWNLCFAFVAYFAAGLAKLTGTDDQMDLFMSSDPVSTLDNFSHAFAKMGWATIAIGGALLLIYRPLSRMMHFEK